MKHNRILQRDYVVSSVPVCPSAWRNQPGESSATLSPLKMPLRRDGEGVGVGGGTKLVWIPRPVAVVGKQKSSRKKRNGSLVAGQDACFSFLLGSFACTKRKGLVCFLPAEITRILECLCLLRSSDKTKH